MFDIDRDYSFHIVDPLIPVDHETLITNTYVMYTNPPSYRTKKQNVPVHEVRGDDAVRLGLNAYKSAMWCFWCRAGLRNNLRALYPSATWIDQHSWINWFYLVKSDVNKRQGEEVAREIEQNLNQQIAPLTLLNKTLIQQKIAETLDAHALTFKSPPDLPIVGLKAVTYTQFGSPESLWDLLIWISLNFVDFTPSSSSGPHPLNSSSAQNLWQFSFEKPLPSNESNSQSNPSLDPKQVRWIFNPKTERWFKQIVKDETLPNSSIDDWSISQQVVDRLYMVGNIDDARFDVPVYKRGGFYLLLESMTLLCSMMPSYQSMVGYFWPVPKQYTTSSLLCQWLLRQQWRWHYFERDGNLMPLLNKLLPQHIDAYLNIQAARLNPSVSQYNTTSDEETTDPSQEYLTILEHIHRQVLVKTHEEDHSDSHKN
jgi:hypothetical protein